MASTKRKSTKDGREYYEIRVHRGRGLPTGTTRWYIPDGWSQKAIDRELAKVSAEYERVVKAGEVLTRKEKKALEAQEAAERAKIKTLRQYAEQVYLPAKAVTAARRTTHDYKWLLEKYVFPAIGETLLVEITAAQVSALLLALQKRGLAHATVVKVYAVLGNIFKSATLDDSVAVNIMGKVTRPKPRKDELQNDEPESYTVEEIVHIRDCLKHEPLKWQCFVRLLVETGCRRGEVCGLAWKDINLNGGEIKLTSGLTYVPGEGTALDTPKGKKARIVPISPTMCSMLRSLRSEGGIVSTWVFPQTGAPEKPMFPDSPTQYLAKFGRKYGIQELHPHKLRHSFASIALTSGADVVSVSELLGHADVATTLRIYSHASEESRRRASNIFQAALEEKKA